MQHNSLTSIQQTVLQKTFSLSDYQKIETNFKRRTHLTPDDLPAYLHVLALFTEKLLPNHIIPAVSLGFFEISQRSELENIFLEFTKWNLQLDSLTSMPAAITSWIQDVTNPIPAETAKLVACDDFRRNFTIEETSYHEKSDDDINTSIFEMLLKGNHDYTEIALLGKWIIAHGGQEMLSFIPHLFNDNKLLLGRTQTIIADWQFDKQSHTPTFFFEMKALQSTNLDTNITTYKFLNKLFNANNTDELEEVKNKEKILNKALLQPIITIKGKCYLTIENKKEVKPQLTFSISNSAGNAISPSIAAPSLSMLKKTY